MLKDMTNRVITVGDIVIFTQPGAGRNLPSLCFGEVIGLTKASVKVFYLEKNHKRRQHEEMIDDLTRPPRWTGMNGKHYYHQVGTGRLMDNPPDSVRFYPDRFYIVGRV